ncbi:MAG TPA: alpha/beta hydrolase [Vicinamibacterales bacterium]|nr:alpha/beta hydrolase [Vicinamibacterales bacterium]
MQRLWTAWAIVLCCGPFGGADPGVVQKTETLPLRGHTQSLHVFGVAGDRPVIVSSGDGGWLHLGPHVAHLLAAHGYYVLGFDVKAYLESFTSGSSTLNAAEEPADFRALSEFAREGSSSKPILVGISEGAGLSVLAASDPLTRKSIGGVVAIGLPDRNELGWRWKDSVIYLTHGVPNEPTFSAASFVGQVAPVPLALLHSTHDEFVPLSDAQRMLGLAAEPRRMWVVNAADHRFSDNLSVFDQNLLEALDWVSQHEPR